MESSLIYNTDTDNVGCSEGPKVKGEMLIFTVVGLHAAGSGHKESEVEETFKIGLTV